MLSFIYYSMGVSYSGGTSRSSIFKHCLGFSIINILGIPHLWDPPYAHVSFQPHSSQQLALWEAGGGIQEVAARQC